MFNSSPLFHSGIAVFKRTKSYHGFSELFNTVNAKEYLFARLRVRVKSCPDRRRNASLRRKVRVVTLHYVCSGCGQKSDGPSFCVNKECERVGSPFSECNCDGDHPPQVVEIGLRDGLDLLDTLNRRVTFRGYNSLQVNHLRKISAEQWARIRAEYRAWNKKMRVFGVWGPFVCLALSMVGFYYLHGWMRSVAGAAGALALIGVGRFDGHREGYEEGYSSGLDAGINRALELTEDDLKFISEASTDMELHELRRAGKAE